MYVCKLMPLSLPHVLILYIYITCISKLCVITIYCKCVSTNKYCLLSNKINKYIRTIYTRLDTKSHVLCLSLHFFHKSPVVLNVLLCNILNLICLESPSNKCLIYLRRLKKPVQVVNDI